MTLLTVIGLGEAGRIYAGGLARAGARVRGYDPFLALTDPGFEQCDTLEAALDGAEAVLSLVGARAARAVAEQFADIVAGRDGAAPIFADLNTASPELKADLARMLQEPGVLVADAAVLAPVPRAGHRTPLLVSGPGAAGLARLLAPFGVPIEALGGEPGDAARVKLLRSVFMKGLAALVIETLGAAEASGQRDRLAGQIAAELGPDGGALVERLVSGSYAHAERREHEVAAALAELRRLEMPSEMTAATLAWFRRITAEAAEPGEISSI